MGKLPSLVEFASIVDFFSAAVSGFGAQSGSMPWWIITLVFHVPYFLIIGFMIGGLIERFGFYWRGRAQVTAGRMPTVYPSVCVQLPMFNEHAVAERVIRAASAMTWPADRLSIQVLDDSTDDDTRLLVEEVCASIRTSTGLNCSVRHRVNRQGYKAGALEEGRNETDAEFFAILDSDFVPPKDFLLRTMPHFYLEDGRPDVGLALVQAQWGHLNADESFLTRAQSLWIDDHHTLQMSWRSAMWRFVNFTGTAGVWRSSAIESVGGWGAASLVEDCELSFRHLFAGYRTKFVKEIVVPAELPTTYTAYKAQQKRWTQGWVQLQRLHASTLLFRFRCSWIERIHFLYHMCTAWQWPLWGLWLTLLPIMIYSGHWFGFLGLETATLLYLLPTLFWSGMVAVMASLETKHTYAGKLTPVTLLKRILRIIPYSVINTGMLPHQLCAFAEGLLGPLHTEFERTPKAGSTEVPSVVSSSASSRAPIARKTYRVRVRWLYVLAEVIFVIYQLTWMVFFAINGLTLAVVGAAYVAFCVLYVGFFYGDNAGKVCFVFGRRPLALWKSSTDAGLFGQAEYKRPEGV